MKNAPAKTPTLDPLAILATRTALANCAPFFLLANGNLSADDTSALINFRRGSYYQFSELLTL